LEDDYDSYPDHGSILFHQEKLIDGRGKRSTGWWSSHVLCWTRSYLSLNVAEMLAKRYTCSPAALSVSTQRSGNSDVIRDCASKIDTSSLQIFRGVVVQRHG